MKVIIFIISLSLSQSDGYISFSEKAYTLQDRLLKKHTEIVLLRKQISYN